MRVSCPWVRGREHTRIGFPLCCLCALCGFFLTALEARSQPLYKCRQENGRIAYQSEKCPPGTALGEIAPPPPAPARPVAEEKPAAEDKAAAAGKGPGGEAPAPVTEKDLEKVVGVLAAFERCSAFVPGFAAKHDGAFRQWKQRNLAAMVQYSQDGELQKKVRDSTEYSQRQAREAKADERKYQAENCEQQVAGSLKNP